MKKQSGWVTAIGVAAFLLLRIASMSMQHPDWNANDLIGYAGIVLVVASVIYCGIWLIKQMRTPKPAVATSVKPSTYASAPANTTTMIWPVPAAPAAVEVPSAVCKQCQYKIESNAKFCSECGSTQEKAKCANCQFELAAGAKFCPECGNAQS